MNNIKEKYLQASNKIDKMVSSEVIGRTLYLSLYGDIAPDKISYQDVVSEVKGKIEEAGEVVIKVNSAGGSVQDGLAIYDFLSEFKEKTTVIVEGIAASISSVIALCGSKLLMAPSSFLLIHLPYVEQTSGNSFELNATAKYLNKIEEKLVEIYTSKCGKTLEEIFSKLKEETIFSPSEAIEYGLADGITRLANNFIPNNILAYSNLEAEKTEKIIQNKLHKEIHIMKNKIQADIADLKAMIQEVKNLDEEVSAPVEEVPAEVVEEIKEEVLEEVKEEIVEEVIQEVTPEMEAEPVDEMEEEVKPEEAVAESIEIAMVLEYINQLQDSEGNLVAADLIAALSSGSLVEAYKSILASVKAKASVKKVVSNKLPYNVVNKKPEVKAEAVKSSSKLSLAGLQTYCTKK